MRELSVDLRAVFEVYRKATDSPYSAFLEALSRSQDEYQRLCDSWSSGTLSGWIGVLEAIEHSKLPFSEEEIVGALVKVRLTV